MEKEQIRVVNPKKEIPLIGKITPTNSIAREVFRDKSVKEALAKLELHESSCKKPFCKAQFADENHCKTGRKLYDTWWRTSENLRIKLTKEVERDLSGKENNKTN